MFWDIIFWLSLAAGLVTGGIFFRDLGDVSQMFMKVDREKMLSAIAPSTLTPSAGILAGLLLLARDATITNRYSGSWTDLLQSEY